MPSECWRSAASLALAVCLFACACGGEPDAAPRAGASLPASAFGRPPNVLVVIADDLSSAAFGAFGGELIETPGLDRLARGGFRFRRAICASPFCTPSRQSFLTGRWPHAIGVTQLNSALRPDIETMATVFARAGFRTAAFGKMHWARKQVGDASYGFELVLDRKQWEDGLQGSEARDYERYRELWRQDSREAWSTLNPEREACPLPEERQLAPWLIEHALEFLQADEEAPALTFLSFYEPHAPFSFPPRLRAAVNPDSLSLEEWDSERGHRDAPGLEAWWRERLREHGPLEPATMRGVVAAYLQSVLWLDEQVAALLDRLAASGLERNTIVLFWSDNGFFLGDRGVVGKSFPYRRAAEVALSLSGPGIPAGETDALVQTIDVFPTLCELVGIPPPRWLDGRSLAPLLAGAGSIRETAFSELVGVVGSIQSQRYKLMIGQSPGAGWDLVYDLRADPFERHALRHEEVDAAEVSGLRDEMYRLLLASPADGIPAARWMTQADRTQAIRWALAQIDRGSTASTQNGARPR